MKSFWKSFFCTLLMGAAVFQNLSGNTVRIQNSSGKVFEIGVDSNDRFLDVLGNIEIFLKSDEREGNDQNNGLLGTDGTLLLNNLEWNLTVTHAGITARAQQGVVRDYSIPPTRQQREDITFILNELAWEGPVSIWGKQSELEKAGARIDSVHPFRFLEVVFSTDKNIAAISAIKERKVPKLKSKFFKGLTDSLKDEASRNNLMPFVDDFAKKLEISKKRIIPALEGGDYNRLIDILIELKPRQEARYHDF